LRIEKKKIFILILIQAKKWHLKINEFIDLKLLIIFFYRFFLNRKRAQNLQEYNHRIFQIDLVYLRHKLRFFLIRIIPLPYFYKNTFPEAFDKPQIALHVTKLSNPDVEI
jgi:hypothetical protein